jgi:hypothetical protein
MTHMLVISNAITTIQDLSHTQQVLKSGCNDNNVYATSSSIIATQYDQKTSTGQEEERDKQDLLHSTHISMLLQQATHGPGFAQLKITHRSD